MASPALIFDTDQWKTLQAHVGAIHRTHLRDLMADADRCKAMSAEFEGVYLDFVRQQATTETVDKLFNLAEAAKLKEKIDKMFNGDKVATDRRGWRGMEQEVRSCSAHCSSSESNDSRRFRAAASRRGRDGARGWDDIAMLLPNWCDAASEL